MEPVKYKEMLAHAAAQVQQRAGLLSGRVFLITWPFLVLIALQYVAVSVYAESVSIQIRFSLLSIWAIFSIFYGLIAGTIFHIEKILWVDSYFDGHNLTPQQSWRIARRLLLPTFKLYFVLMLRYFIIPILFIIGGIFLLGPVSNYFSVNGSNMQAVLGALGVGLFFFLPTIYIFILKIKMRFIWFLFLDTYGSDISWKDFFSEIKKLNSVATRQSVTKTLIAEFGAGTLSGLASVLTSGLRNNIDQAVSGGQAIGRVISFYINSVANQMAALGRNAAIYLLYLYARAEIHQNGQEINEALYDLGRK